MAKNYEVLISGFAFDQQNLTISAGDTVTWINDDSSNHSVTQDAGSPLPITEIDLGPNVYSPRQDFGTVGVLKYHCKYHMHMKGSVTVT